MAGFFHRAHRAVDDCHALLEILACELPTTGTSAVCTEIPNSGVVVMESAKDGARIDDTGSLNRARDRRILVQ
jgi:DNA polymerase III subunit epsilon